MKSFYSIIRKASLTIAATAALLIPTTGQTAEGWLVDFEKAKAQAAKEGKSLLMEFTGSDWCP
ncbi:MAG: thioredoxin family protein, partial [Verrucomicrobiota bacterium]|nr:thioredoxin family protein [Verrucomicrobiota bacterium]